MSNSFETEIEPPEMETLAALAENLIYRLPGCSDLMVRKTIQEVYRDFCRRSCCLRARRHFTISHYDESVICTPFFGGIIDCIGEVKVDGRVLLHQRDYVTVRDRVMFSKHILPAEGESRDVELYSIEIPRLNSESAPKWFIDDYGESICAGVLMKLQGMSGKSWSDPTESSINRIAYENAIGEERTRYYAGNENGHFEFGFCTNDLI